LPGSRFPRSTLAVLLLIAYPILTHVAMSTGLVYLGWIAWLCLAALVLMAAPAKWRLAGFVLLIVPLALVDAETLLKAPPVVINLALAAWFGMSLRKGEEPMIGWFARLERGDELSPELATYTRRLTVLWTVFFVTMAATAALLAVFAAAETWSIFANGVDYVLIGILFVGEYAYRRVRYRHYRHASLVELVRTVVRSGRLAPRRTGRK
jgi:uncharacterized membrane protein